MVESTGAFGKPYLQNRELSWLSFNERVLDQGADSGVALLDRLNFVSIFQSNLREFFMVRVGSLKDLSLVKKTIRDTKSGLTPDQQLQAIYQRCHELYPVQEKVYEDLRKRLAKKGVSHLRPADLSPRQREFLTNYAEQNIIPSCLPKSSTRATPSPIWKTAPCT